MSKKYIQIITTCEKKKDAEKIAKALIEKRLAACIQIMPINSIYWWKEKIEKAKEWILFIKTEKKLYERIESAIKTLHSYETPEIIAMPIIKGDKKYLEWVSETVRN